jgi:hypothetical protein
MCCGEVPARCSAPAPHTPCERKASERFPIAGSIAAWYRVGRRVGRRGRSTVSSCPLQRPASHHAIRARGPPPPLRQYGTISHPAAATSRPAAPSPLLLVSSQQQRQRRQQQRCSHGPGPVAGGVFCGHRCAQRSQGPAPPRATVAALLTAALPFSPRRRLPAPARSTLILASLAAAAFAHLRAAPAGPLPLRRASGPGRQRSAMCSQAGYHAGSVARR